MPTWIKAVLRVVGALNTVLFIAGVYGLFSAARWALFDFKSNEMPAFRIVFLVMTVINLVLLSLFATAAIKLLRLRKSGIIIHTIASLSLIAYGFLISFIWGLNLRFSRSVAASTGVGNMGLAPFEFAFVVPDLYPIVSTLALLIIRWKMAGTPHQTQGIAEAGLP
jgi:hypothetical protein